MPSKFTIVSENFNGGENNSAEPTALAENQLQKAENCRLSLMGGFSPRPGYEQVDFATFTGEAAFQGVFETDYGIYFVDKGKIYLTLEDLSDAFEIGSGLSTTARCSFFEFNGDVFLMNGEDRPRRIVKSTLLTDLVAATSVTLDVPVGHGDRFGHSGTLTVVSGLGGNAISYTARTDDQFTITDTTVEHSHLAGAIVTEVIVLNNVPIGSFGAVFQNTWFMAGVKSATAAEGYNDNVILNSVGWSFSAPEGFWDFNGVGAGATPLDDRGAVTCIKNTKSYLLIGKKDKVFYCSGFYSNDLLALGLITDVYGIAGPDSAATIGRDIVVFTGTAIKRIGEQEGLNNTVPSLDATFDAAFSTYLKTELADDQSEASFTYNAKNELAKLWVTLKNGLKECIVIDNKMNPVTQERRNAWTRDTNKPASRAIVYKNQTYWISETEPKIFKDEFGYSDNGLNILTIVKGPDFNLGKPRESKYFATHFIRGSLYAKATVKVNYYFDGELVDTLILDEDLVSSVMTGTLGTISVGQGTVGGAPRYQALIGYEFEIEKLLLKRKDTGRMSIEYICQGQAQVFEIKTQQLSGVISDRFNKKIRI